VKQCQNEDGGEAGLFWFPEKRSGRTGNKASYLQKKGTGEKLTKDHFSTPSTGYKQKEGQGGGGGRTPRSNEKNKKRKIRTANPRNTNI